MRVNLALSDEAQVMHQHQHQHQHRHHICSQLLQVSRSRTGQCHFVERIVCCRHVVRMGVHIEFYIGVHRLRSGHRATNLW